MASNPPPEALNPPDRMTPCHPPTGAQMAPVLSLAGLAAQSGAAGTSLTGLRSNLAALAHKLALPNAGGLLGPSTSAADHNSACAAAAQAANSAAASAAVARAGATLATGAAPGGSREAAAQAAAAVVAAGIKRNSEAMMANARAAAHGATNGATNNGLTLANNGATNSGLTLTNGSPAGHRVAAAAPELANLAKRARPTVRFAAPPRTVRSDPRTVRSDPPRPPSVTGASYGTRMIGPRSPALSIHTISPSIHTIALSIYTIALSIRTVALSIHTIALSIHTIALGIHILRTEYHTELAPGNPGCSRDNVGSVAFRTLRSDPACQDPSCRDRLAAASPTR
eukprot:1185139-Prorocentrum_minimum.AAC.2